jgi:ribonuclease T2
VTRAGLLAPALLGTMGVAQATVPISGQLVAERACPALASIKQSSNPGALMLQPGHRYPVVGKNRQDASHYLIQLDLAAPAQRWVAVSCGRLVQTVGAAQPLPRSAPAKTATPNAPARAPMQLILAASWQNAFCERQGRRPECRDLDAGDAAAGRFSLHGLWPQPISNDYCGVSERERRESNSGDWADLPPLPLSAATRARLDGLMPGTRSYLQRHEWTKHGRCYGTDAETYFGDAMDLVEQLNATPVPTLFADNIGHHLSATAVREAFSRAFGRDAGERLRLECEDGLITELRISLKGSPGGQPDLARWIGAAPAKSGGCRGGRVDGAGLGRH